MDEMLVTEFLEFLDGKGLVITDWSLVNDALSEISITENTVLKFNNPPKKINDDDC